MSEPDDLTDAEIFDIAKRTSDELLESLKDLESDACTITGSFSISNTKQITLVTTIVLDATKIAREG
jgi:hypothetical protein